MPAIRACVGVRNLKIALKGFYHDVDQSIQPHYG